MYNQLILSARLGDGSFITQNHKGCPRYALHLSSINEDYLKHKLYCMELTGVKTSGIKTGVSGYTGNKNILYFRTHVDDDVSIIGNMDRCDVIYELNKLGLTYLYLDDGSFHKNRKFGHIYCNSFNSLEVDTLVYVINREFGGKPCKLRFDRKSNGREYPYIYIPVCTMSFIAEYVYYFLKDNQIYSMMYKVGSPSTTIESGSSCRNCIA